ncbi:hypothetical protein H0H92_000086 [Tricholoma furcatifolium]|nr:hypothetical protein H0H92_000086 [Tricholoma furcatifolium]
MYTQHSNGPVAPRTLASFSLEGKDLYYFLAVKDFTLKVYSGCTSLAIIDLKSAEAEQAADELKAYAVERGFGKAEDFKFVGYACDVSLELSVQQVFDQIMEAFGKIDVVVASAGIVENYSALDYPSERIKRLYDVNVHGVYYTAREAARKMIPQGCGSIILISSMSANIVNIPQLQTPYNASKAAVKHMAASLAVEWAKTGIRVNSLSPGYMLTKLTRTILENQADLKINVLLQKTWEGLTPMGRMGEPEDLAGAIVFLASDASKFMTGSEIRVDGGYCWMGGTGAAGYTKELLVVEYDRMIDFQLRKSKVKMTSLTTKALQPSLWSFFQVRTTTFRMSSETPPKTFEFTKRKRWADLLVTELADGINIILSQTCTILYCAPIVTEITGWKSTDLIDSEDQNMFRASFEASINNTSPLLAYIRINCVGTSASYPFPPKNMLFEVQGHPSPTTAEGILFFAVMKPFPSRNTESLSTFVDIKMDNERLQRRHMELHQRLPQKTVVSPLTVAPIQIYATSPINLSSSAQIGVDSSRASVDSNLFNGGVVPPANLSSLVEDEIEDTSRRKKLKKAAGEQYGPLGPKTLCNACGLRWAKQARTGNLKVEEAAVDSNIQYEQ